MATIKALKAGNRLADVDAATAQAVLGLARAVDQSPDSASLWNSFARVLRTLLEHRPDQIATAKAARSASVLELIKGGAKTTTKAPQAPVEAAVGVPAAKRRPVALDPTTLAGG